ncbi:MAG: Na+/H+ antiporter subunit E [Balneolaceae bacterium]
MNKLSLFSMVMSFISLMLFWVIMSGYLDFIHLSMGVATVAGVIFFNYHLKNYRFFEDDIEDLNQFRFGQAFSYVPWMIYQIFVAAIHVAWVIIRPHLRVETSMITFKVDLPSSHAKMILGNSISLTPGTLTITIEGDEFTVHSLTPGSHEGIINDAMPRRVLKLFSKEERQVVSDIRITTETKTN